MSIRVAYGPKGGIDPGIRSGEIPKGCLIVTKTNSGQSEYMFYDTAGEMKSITAMTQFQNWSEVNAYIAENEKAGRAASEMSGRIISVLGEDGYDAYQVQDNGGTTLLARAEDIKAAVEQIETSLSLMDRVAIVRLGGEALEVDKADNSVNIPLATAEKLGLVRGSEKVNGVSINEDGTMTVNPININKLVQTDGDTVIFVCGDSTM